MQKHDGDEEAFCALTLRPATSEDEPFLRNLFATTRADELSRPTSDPLPDFRKTKAALSSDLNSF
ncbi:MAG TPA: hypothetical protein VF899_18055 [Pyrinomonadaceae bacterium]